MIDVSAGRPLGLYDFCRLFLHDKILRKHGETLQKCILRPSAIRYSSIGNSMRIRAILNMTFKSFESLPHRVFFPRKRVQRSKNVTFLAANPGQLLIFDGVWAGRN